MVIVGSGKYTYEAVESWADYPRRRLKSWGEVPKGHGLTMIPSMGVDSKDRIYALNRDPNYVYVFDHDGNFLQRWGNELYKDFTYHSVHGLYVSPDDKVYIVDTRDHTVRKFSLDGELLLTLGTEGEAGKNQEPFSAPTAAAVSGSGDIFISDGYGNARVHKFSPEGELIKSWGKPGSGIGEFMLPHGIWVDKKDRVWVNDRQNFRIQIFTTEGKYLKQLNNFDLPCNIFMDSDDIVYIPEAAGRVSILNLDGEVLAQFGGEKEPLLDYIKKWKRKGFEAPENYISYLELYSEIMTGPGQFCASHGICADSRGDLYASEVYGSKINKFIRQK